MKFKWTYQGADRQRVRTFLMGHGITRSLLRRIKFHGGEIEVNQAPVRVVDFLQPGDCLTLTLPPETENDHVVLSPIPLDVLYEDDHFLIVNKPAGVASMPFAQNHTDTMINRVKAHLAAEHAESLKIHVVTRLDRDTSGAMLFAKHHFAHSVLDQQLKKHAIEKRYLAVVTGQVTAQHAMIDEPIGRLPGSFVARMVRADGKPAQTEYWTVARGRDASLVRLQLHSGRTHQIRVHMTAIGHPLVGDWLYGKNNNPYIHRQALHCAKLTFYHPFLATPITCYASMPKDMADLIAREINNDK